MLSWKLDECKPLIRGVLFFSLKGIYDYLRPLMFVIGLFCVYQGYIVFWMAFTVGPGILS